MVKDSDTGNRNPRTIEIDRFVRGSALAEDVIASIEGWAQRREWAVRSVSGGQRGIAEVGLSSSHLTLMYLGGRTRRLEPLPLARLVDLRRWLDRNLVELGLLRTQISQQLEELSKQGELLAKATSENQRLRSILATHNIDPDAPLRAMSVFRDAVGINRRELLGHSIVILTLLVTMIGVAVNVQQRDIALGARLDAQEHTVVLQQLERTERACLAAQKSVEEAPAQYFEPDLLG